MYTCQRNKCVNCVISKTITKNKNKTKTNQINKTPRLLKLLSMAVKNISNKTILYPCSVQRFLSNMHQYTCIQMYVCILKLNEYRQIYKTQCNKLTFVRVFVFVRLCSNFFPYIHIYVYTLVLLVVLLTICTQLIRLKYNAGIDI